MDFLTDRLSEQYGSFPEAVIFLYAGQILYSNEAGICCPPWPSTPAAWRSPWERHFIL